MANGAFARHDERDDALFYAQPRLVNHIEAGAIAALTRAYAQILPGGGRILDFMSAWRSHLPAGLEAPHPFAEVVGLGMNAREMAENPQLDAAVVHDVNAEPVLPFADDAFDGATCTVSVQYLTSPHEVFAEMRRVLAPGGPFAVAFSNRCFPTKAVAIWQVGGADHHADLVSSYLQIAGFDGVEVAHLSSPDDPISVVTGLA